MSEQHLPIARNTATLAVIQALYSAVLQLGAAVLSLSFVLVTGFRSLLGAGPAIFSPPPRSPHSPRGGRWTVSAASP